LKAAVFGYSGTETVASLSDSYEPLFLPCFCLTHIQLSTALAYALRRCGGGVVLMVFGN